MSGTFDVLGNMGQAVIIFQNSHGKSNVVIVVKNTEANFSSKGSVEAIDDVGTQLIAPALRPGGAIAFSVPASTRYVELINLNDVLKAEVTVLV